MLAQLRQGTAPPRQTVVVQPEDDSARGLSLLGLDLFLFGIGGRVLRTLRSAGARVVSLPAESVEALAERGEVRYVSPDQPTRVFGHVEGRTNDPYGHGTHVASLAAGSGQTPGGAHTGVAPGAHTVNLRVLGSDGAETTSGLLAAPDWVMTSRAAYNVRVVNMSLGAPAIDSHRSDPVCRAVRRRADAGIVVAAAGNDGKDADGNKVYGRIHSPGNEPSAITVGASNIFGTDARFDDQVTAYSSRGLTRASRTDEAGVRHYDNVIKPDLVVPGNRLAGVATRSSLIASHPEFSAGGRDDRRMMYLSGMSMAAPVVAGAAALLLTAAPPAARMSIAGSSFAWAQGVVPRRARATGPELIGKFQKVYAAGRTLGDGGVETIDSQSLDPAAMTAGVSLGPDILTSDGTPLGGGSLCLNASQLLSYGIIMGDGIVVGDGILKGDGIVMGDANSWRPDSAATPRPR